MTTDRVESISNSTHIARLSAAAFSILIFVLLEAFYRDTIQPAFEGRALTRYDQALMDQLRPLLLLYAGLPSLFVGAEYRPSRQFVAVLNILVYIPILVCAPSFLGDLATEAVSAVFLGMIIVAIMSNGKIQWKLTGRPRMFWTIFVMASVVVAAILLGEAARNGVRFAATLEEKREIRETLQYSVATGYALNIWTYCLGPLWLALLMTAKRYLYLPLAFAPFILAYAVASQTVALVAPIWILSVYAAAWMTGSFRYISTLLFMAAPLGLALYLNFAFDNNYDTIIGLRLYSIHGQIFAHYIDFFGSNPNTWFSHIKGLNWLIQYPYDQNIAVLIGQHYPGGNQNANFWTQDGIAGAGIWAIPFVSVVFGCLLIVINATSEGVPVPLVAAATSMAAFRFADGTIATALLTGGLGLLILLMMMMPRDQKTSGHHIERRSRKPVHRQIAETK